MLRQPWVWMALALATMVAGFWPSFFAQLGETDLPHLVHGVSATLWMAAAVLQSWLISRRNVRLHRVLGRWLLLLPPVIVLSGLQMIAVMLTETSNPPPLVSFKFAYLDTAGLVFFLLGIIIAVRHARRRNIALHLRWMACTVLLALEPALERLYLTVMPGLVTDFDDALYAALFTVEAILVVLIVRDWRAGRRRTPYWALLGFFVFIHATATPVATHPGFQAFALRLAGSIS
jgi:uncharacterized membrane protein